MFIPFLFFGLYIALTMLVYFDMNKTLSDSYVWFKQIFYIDLKKNVFKYSLFLIIIFSSVMLFSFADNKLALITPRYSIKSNEIRGTLALHRPINVDDWTLVKRKYSNISITYPLYNHTKYVMIDNPSNIKSKPIFTFNINNDKLTISDLKNYHNKKLLRVDLPIDSSGWETFDARISYDFVLIAPISIYENLTRIESLGNQFYTLNYTLLIENNYNETLGSYSTFAGFELDPRVKRNTTITYYENNENKGEAIAFMISNDWFYPRIHVQKNSTIKMQWIIKGTS